MKVNKKSTEVRVFTHEYVEDLLGSARLNDFKDYSSKKKFDYQDNYAEGSSNVFIDKEKLLSKMEMDKPKGAPANWQSLQDRKNAQLFYESIYFLEDNGDKRPLTPFEASDRRLWTYLSHSIFWEYLQSRWGSKDVAVRYFLTGKRNDLTFGKLSKHGVSRLWWYAYITYDLKAKDPYHLLDVLCSNSDLTMIVSESLLSHNRKVLKAILTVLGSKKEYQLGGTGKAMRFIISSLNAESGISNLAILSEAELINRITHFATLAPK